MELTLSLESLNKIYYAGESITGNVLIINKSKATLKFDLKIKLYGYYTLKKKTVNPPQVNLVRFYKKELTILKDMYSTVGGNNTFHFRFPANSDSCVSPNIYESYHGVSMSVGYDIVAEAVCNDKTFTSKKSSVTIMAPGQGITTKFGRKKVPYHFIITPETIDTCKLDKSQIPKFKIECFIESINCCIDKPFNGFYKIIESSLQIKSIELQFVRNEKILANGYNNYNEVSEIQNLQIGDGDVIRNIEIPIYMIYPRIFCCSNLKTNEVDISFEMNIIVVFINGVVIMYNFPIILWRG